MYGIHSISIFSILSVVKSQRKQIQEKNLDIPLLSDPFQLVLRDPEAFPGKKRYTIPPVTAESLPRPPTSGTCLEILWKEVSSRCLITCLNHLNSLFLMWRSNSALFFQSFSKPHDLRWGSGCRQTCKSRALPFNTDFSSPWQIVNLRNAIIPATSYLALNCHSACWKSWLEDASRTTSFASSSDETLRVPNQMPSSTWLWLKIMSTNTTNSILNAGILLQHLPQNAWGTWSWAGVNILSRSFNI